ncbi:MAG: hypothetical protein CMJ21_02575 [Phycisphaerae bacterium]|nr:hypothetical protein [Phycisphaerae bacterium]
MTQPNTPQPAPNDSGTTTPSPRAFAQGTGIVLQTVGVILFLSTCCVCTSAGLWDPAVMPGTIDFSANDTDGPTRLADLRSDPGKVGLMLTVVSMTVGGLALAVFGLGLQSDKPRASCGATVTVIVLVIVLIAAGVALWRGESSITVRVWHAVLTAITALLVPFVLTSLKQVSMHPPPSELDVLPPDFDVDAFKEHHRR